MIRNVGQSLIRGSALGRAQRGLFHGKEKIYGNNVSYSNKKCVLPTDTYIFHSNICFSFCIARVNFAFELVGIQNAVASGFCTSKQILVSFRLLSLIDFPRFYVYNVA